VGGGGGGGGWGAQGGLAAGPAPVGALGGEGQGQEGEDPVIGGAEVAGDADDDVALADVEFEAAVEAIPPGKDHRIIGVGLGADNGVMHPVHAGGDEDAVEAAFPGQGQAQIAVVEHGAAVEHQFIDQVGEGQDTDEDHLEEAEDGGIEHFAEVEAEGGGDVHVRVGVVDVVEAPEEGPGVVEAVPVVEGEVHEEDAGGHLEPEGQGGEVEEPEGAGLGPEGGGQGGGPDGEDAGDKAQAGEGEVHRVAAGAAAFEAAQGGQGFQGQEQEKEAGDEEGGDGPGGYGWVKHRHLEAGSRAEGVCPQFRPLAGD
jgi:hypothetical protein